MAFNKAASTSQITLYYLLMFHIFIYLFRILSDACIFDSIQDGAARLSTFKVNTIYTRPLRCPPTTSYFRGEKHLDVARIQPGPHAWPADAFSPTPRPLGLNFLCNPGAIIKSREHDLALQS